MIWIDPKTEYGSRSRAPLRSGARRRFLRTWLCALALVLAPGLAGAASSAFDLWYGAPQQFGQLGNPQQWVNVLGNVSDTEGLTGLSYTLNGGPSRPLNTGPDTRRLLEPGDFNIDLDFADLIDGANAIVFSATDALGDVTQFPLTLNYTAGNVWPRDYTAAWGSAAAITDVAQVVDGRWSLVPGGIRPDVMGYDRIVAIGDIAWTDYEVTVPITIHDFDPNGFNYPSTAPGLGLIHRWLGHTEASPGEQPLSFYEPIGVSFWYDFAGPRVFLAGVDGLLVENNPRQLDFDVTYIWKLRGETQADGFTQYSAKLWPATDPEPAAWDLTGMDGPGDLASGSLLLVAHHMDATFGDLEVVSLANDTAPAVISNVKVKAGVDVATIRFTTNKPTTATLEYGLTAAYGSTLVELDSSTLHAIDVAGLQPEATYHFRILADDGLGNIADSGDKLFVLGKEFTSDDFSAPSLDTNLWTFVDPRSDSTATVNGTQLEIMAPGSDFHGVWTNGDFLPRLQQQVADVDFEVEAKFESDLTGNGNFQGILIEEGPGRVIRVEFNRSTAGDTRLFVAGIFDTTYRIELNQYLGAAAPMYLRVGRVGDDFTVWYSFDGTSFVPAVVFDQAMSVNNLSVYAGNDAGIGHTAVVDYFFNTASPIFPEDSGEVPLNVSVVGNGTVLRTPDAPYYPVGTLVQLEAVPGNVDWAFDHWEGDVTGSANPIDVSVTGTDSITAHFVQFQDTLPPQISNLEVSTTDVSATVEWTTDEPATSELHVGTSPGVYTLPPVTDGALATVHSLAIAGLSPDTDYYFEVVSEDALANPSSSGDQTFRTNPEGFGTFVSDDFRGASLNGGLWTFIDPRSDSTAVLNGTQLEINAPASDFHSVWTTGNFLPRVTQAVADVDFEVEAKFESLVGTEGALQGILVEQDPGNVLRIEFHRYAGQTNIFVASIFGPTYQIRLQQSLPLSQPSYLRVGRTGDLFTVSYSIDGVGFVPAVSFFQPMTVNQIGVYAGNSAGTAHTAVVDYFFNTATPVLAEDGVVPLAVAVVGNGSVSLTPDQPTYVIGDVVQLEAIPGNVDWAFDHWEGDLTGGVNPTSIVVAETNAITAHFVQFQDTLPPQISGLQVTIRDTSATVDWTTDEPATSELHVGTSPGLYTLPPVLDGALATAHSLTIAGLIPDSDYFFEAASEDAASNRGVSGDQGFHTAPEGYGQVISDDFSGASLDTSLWTFIDPRSDSTATLNGGRLEIMAPGTDFHSVWTNGNYLPRVVQPVVDIDFEAEVKFESTLTVDGQLQGILIEEDPDNVLRIEFHRNGGQTNIFAASIFGGAYQIHLLQPLALSQPMYLRVGRIGDLFTVSYSFDGSSFVPAASFFQPMTVNQIGVYAGNNVGAGHTAVVDYFFNTAMPVPVEDGVVALDVVVVGNGSVTRTPDQPSYLLDDVVQLEAIPGNVDWSFDHWEGDLTGSANPTNLVVGASNSVTAHFVQFQDTLPPQISGLQVAVTDTSATVDWTTNEPATSELYVGTSPGVYTLPPVLDGALVTSHSLVITGLDPDSDYSFEVASEDAATNLGVSGDQAFHTDPAPVAPVNSDDFSGASLDTNVWTFIDPLADSTATLNGTQLEIAASGSNSHTAWTDGNTLPRVVQPVADADFQVEAKFESTLKTHGDHQGIIVEQGPDDFIRIEFLYFVRKTTILVASVFGGVVQGHLFQDLPLTVPMFLRVGRVGDEFSVSYSFDGETFVPAASFSQAMTVNQVGVYAGNVAGAGHTAVVDYFFDTSAPIVAEDGEVALAVAVVGNGSVAFTPDQPTYLVGDVVQLEAIPGNVDWAFDHWEGDLTGGVNPTSIVVAETNAITAHFVQFQDTLPPQIADIQVTTTDVSATVEWTTDEPATSELTVGTSPGVYTLPPVTDGALVTAHSLVIAGLSPDSDYFFAVASEDAATNRGSSADQGFHTELAGFGQPVSDEFDGASLDTSLWTFIDPRSDSTATLNGGRLEIAAPGSDFHSVWTDGNYLPRVSQDVADVDFAVEARFDSALTIEGQLQGILVEQDPDNVLRIEFHSFGGQTNIFVASIFGGGYQTHLLQSLLLSPPMYLRVARVGDVFTVSYSLDGASFVPAASFAQAMVVDRIGVFSGNAVGSGHTAVVDHFRNVATP